MSSDLSTDRKPMLTCAIDLCEALLCRIRNGAWRVKQCGGQLGTSKNLLSLDPSWQGVRGHSRPKLNSCCSPQTNNVRIFRQAPCLTFAETPAILCLRVSESVGSIVYSCVKEGLLRMVLSSRLATAQHPKLAEALPACRIPTGYIRAVAGTRKWANSNC